MKYDIQTDIQTDIHTTVNKIEDDTLWGKFYINIIYRYILDDSNSNSNFVHFKYIFAYSPSRIKFIKKILFSISYFILGVIINQSSLKVCFECYMNGCTFKKLSLCLLLEMETLQQ